ncbi:MAG: hypothetical protein R2681_16215 [Pyrinomonadaceae bacterium]
MLRAIILSLVLFLALGTIIPMATDYAEAASIIQKKRKIKKKTRAIKYRKYRTKRQAKRSKKPRRKYRTSKVRYRKARTTKKRNSRVRRYKKVRRYTAKRRTVKRKARVRKYSKKWWRSYRARKAKSNAIARRKRALRLKRIRLAKAKRAAKNRQTSNVASLSVSPIINESGANVLPTGTPVPLGWVQNQVTNNVVQFNVDGVNGAQIGSASLTVVGPAVGKSVSEWRNNTVGGVSTTTLRRTVIDRMIRENGWVENDFEKEVAGKKVYVVVAKAPDTNNSVQSQTFYFTEANGRIYSLATKARKEESEKIVEQSEKVLASLQNGKEPVVQQAKNKKDD